MKLRAICALRSPDRTDRLVLNHVSLEDRNLRCPPDGRDPRGADRAARPGPAAPAGGRGEPERPAPVAGRGGGRRAAEPRRHAAAARALVRLAVGRPPAPAWADRAG